MDATEIIKDLFSKDRYAATLGMRLVSADPVVVELPLTRDHENFYDVTHGGAVFSVADCAFSLAANASGDRAVSIDTHLALTAGTMRGDTLIAEAEEVTRGRTVASYRVVVRRSDERVCALFTGTVQITPA